MKKWAEEKCQRDKWDKEINMNQSIYKTRMPKVPLMLPSEFSGC
jgi:hypothetical protein